MRPSPPKSATSARAAALDVVLDEKEEEASLAKQMTEESEKADTDADPETSHANADAGDDWAFVAVLANVTRIKRAPFRPRLGSWYSQTTPTLTTSLSVVRRRASPACSGTCTEYEFHARACPRLRRRRCFTTPSCAYRVHPLTNPIRSRTTRWTPCGQSCTLPTGSWPDILVERWSKCSCATHSLLAN